MLSDLEPISYFKNGDFIDLCAGPHVMRTGNIGAFKLTHVASAYYKGDERNPQLQRIYGTAFKNKTALDEYFKMIEEAKHRDHRKIGQEMGLFAIDTECATSRARSRSSQTWGFATAVLNRHHGQTNREAGAVARLTRDFDGAAVRFHNRFGDGEAEAGAAGGAGA